MIQVSMRTEKKQASILSVWLGVAFLTGAEESEIMFRVGPLVEELLGSNCYSCRDKEPQKSDIRLDHRNEFALNVRLNLFKKIYVHGIHATILHQPGIDHKRLSYRLADVHDKVVRKELAGV